MRDPQGANGYINSPKNVTGNVSRVMNELVEHGDWKDMGVEITCWLVIRLKFSSLCFNTKEKQSYFLLRAWQYAFSGKKRKT